MSYGNRTLSAEVIAALTYWPGVIVPDRDFPPDPVDLTVLPPFFNDLLRDLPWWSRDWGVTQVDPGLPVEIARDESGTRFSEVSVPGTVSSGNGETSPFVAKVRFRGDQLTGFQAKIGDMVIGPAQTPAGQLEPHPFARMFTRLMDLRGLTVNDMARGTYRSMSTINMLRSGRLNPHPALAKQIAAVLHMSQEDVTAISGIDD